MELTVLYPHAKSKFLASILLFMHQVTWIKVGQTIPETPLLVTAGGDGTINYAVNNIDLEKTKLIILPLGRGNALARILELSQSMLTESDMENSEEIEIPLLDVNGRLAVFGAGMGKGGEIVDFANPYSQLGAPSYLASAIKSIQVNPSYNIIINGEMHKDLLTVEALLWGKVGFGVPLTRQNGPKLNLTIIKGHTIQAALLFLLDQIPEWEGARTFSGDSFVLESPIEIPAHIDGETFLTKKLEIKTSERRGKIIKPGKEKQNNFETDL